MFHTWHSTPTHQQLPDRKHASSGSYGLLRRSGPSMDTSHFYEDSSEDELPVLDDYSDVSFNPWAKLKRSSLRGADTRSSLTSFRFSDQSPTWPSDAPVGEALYPLEDQLMHKAPTKSSKKPVRPSVSIPRTNQQFQDNIGSVPEEDLQNYMQTLLGGLVTEGVHQEMDLYQDCIDRKFVHQRRFHPTKPALPSRKRSSYNDKNRISDISNASDASAVPSSIFSDVDVQAQRPSTLSINTHLRAGAPHRNSFISLNSISSGASNRSWFMDDESPPESPMQTTRLEKRVSFTRGIKLGMSCFDDGDDEDEEESHGGILSSESTLFTLMGTETLLKVPKTSLTPQKTRKKQKPALSIETKAPQSPPNMLSPPLPPLTHSPISPRNSICASPNRRRPRRRTASSECIVLEALEKMNAVMYEFANEDINRKSVVGIDLPGNQVSVEAYGELWW